MLRFDQFELDEGNALLTRDGKQVPLPPKAFALLCTLARNPGQLTRKNDLLDAVWGHRHVSESVLKTTISQLRAALADDAARPSYIETASRHGYRFIGRVKPSEGDGNGMAPGAGAPVATAASAVEARNAANSAAPQRPDPLQAPPAQEIAIAQWEPATSADIPPRTRPAMVGRRAFLEVLHSAWKRAGVGRRELVWVAGDPGVGKTVLIDNFVADLEPAVVAYGQCVEQFGAGEPYLPILEALGSLCRRFPELPPMLRAVAPTWLVQMPWLSTPAERESLMRGLTGTSPDRMVRELTELIGRFTQKHPLLFVTEDLHWADPATLRTMAHFARSNSPTRVLWIASFRLTQAIAGSHPLVALRQELRLHQNCTEILLDPFSEAEVGQYLGERMPQSGISETFVRRVHAHTDGLPLFVGSLVDTLLEQDAALTRELLHESSTAPLPVPDNLLGALENQISRLPAEVSTTLESASVCGMEFRASTVAETLGRELTAVIDRADELARQEFWLKHLGVLDLPDGTLDTRYSFRHALYKHAFYQRLPVTQRVTFHRRTARSLAKARTSGVAITSAELASHHELGHEYLAAMRCYAEAALNALSHFAPLEAAHLTEHALTLLPQCPEGPERLEAELGLYAHRGVALTLLHGAGSIEARAALDRVRVLLDVLPPNPSRAPALNGLGWNHFGRTEYAEALAIARRLEALAIAFPNPVLMVYACNLMGLCLAVLGQHESAVEWLERGIATCGQVGDKLPLGAFLFDPAVSMHLHLAVPLLALGFIDRARAQSDLALRMAERSTHPMTRMLGHWLAGMIDVRMGNSQRVAVHGEALGKLFATTQLPQAEGPGLWLRGWAQAQLGDPETGYRNIVAGYELRVKQGLLAGATEAVVYAAEALIAGRHWTEAQEKIEEALTLARRRDEKLLIPEALLILARLELQLGNLAAARTAMLESLQEAQAQRALTPELRARVALAELPDHTSEDLDALDATYARVREGFDTSACVRARELLAARGQEEPV